MPLSLQVTPSCPSTWAYLRGHGEHLSCYQLSLCPPWWDLCSLSTKSYSLSPIFSFPTQESSMIPNTNRMEFNPLMRLSGLGYIPPFQTHHLLHCHIHLNHYRRQTCNFVPCSPVSLSPHFHVRTSDDSSYPLSPFSAPDIALTSKYLHVHLILTYASNTQH